MAELIDTAGLEPVKPTSLRREAIAVIRATLRRAEASDAEVDDALDALVELSKD